MKIIIPDGYTLNPGDLSWDNIRKFGDVEIHDRTPTDQMAERCRDADIILTNKAPVSKAVIDAAKNLKLVSVTATGYNIVDIDAASKSKITVCNVPGYGTASVAQHTLALMLELANLVGANSRAVAAGDWVASRDFSFSKGNIVELQGKTLGIIGFGMIGEQVARIASALGMTILYHSRSAKTTDIATYSTIDQIFQQADVVSLHCPLTKSNEQFVNAALLRQMKREAWIINTARGQLIHEQDLAQALNDGTIAGAALDVLSTEPPPATNPLLTARNCIITPHTAWISYEARTRILHTTASNIESFLKGTANNRVN